MRIGGRGAGFGLCGLSRWLSRCVAAVLAALVVLAVAVPGAWADDAADAADGQSGPTVELHADQKTKVNVEGDAPTYKLGNATVTGGNSSYFIVEVDTGSFTLPADNKAPDKAEVSYALKEDSAFVQGTDVVANGKYKYVAFKSSSNNGTADITSEALQSYLHGLTFNLAGDTAQEVTVAAVDTPLTVTYNGKTYNVILFGGHAYTFIDSFIDWDKAYAAAKGTTFFGAKGHLLTIESGAEHNLIYRSFSNKKGWLGATRYTTAEKAKEDGDTFTLASGGDAWYWVTGPSAGTKFWNGATRTGGSAVGGVVYQNWASNEPNNSWLDSSKEYCAQYGKGESGQWNDLPSSITTIKNKADLANWMQGFYVEYDTGLDLGAGREVSATVQRVDVTYDRDNGRVSAVPSSGGGAAGLRVAEAGSPDGKVLTNTEYETTLSAVQARELDAASVKVTVGGEALSRGDDGYSFEESSGRLTIPAAKVTGAVQISAKVKRLVTIKDDKDAELGVVSLAYNTQLDKAEADDLAKKDGYTVSGYKNKDTDSAYDFSTQVTEDVTLVASYDLDAPTVTIKSDKSQLETRADRASVSVDVKKPVAGVTETITWSKDGSPVDSCANKATCEITEAGTYTVTVTEKDADGKTSSVSQQVTIAAPTEHMVTIDDGVASKTVKVTNGDALGADKVADVAKAGYALSGWRTGDGASFDPAATPVTGPLTVSPVWVLDAPGVTVAASPSKIESVGDRARIEATVTPPAVAGGQVATEYKWFRDGELIDGATGSSYETAEPGTYRVEVAVADPATGETSTAGREVTVAAPDTRTVTVVERDGSRTYVTVEVPNGGTVDVSDLSQVGKDGYELSGWVTTDGKPFDPAKDKLTADMTISPVWKLVEPTVSITDDRGTLRVEVDNPAGAKVEYQWFKDGRLLSGQAGATLEGAGPGAYTVRVTLTDAEGNTVTVERQVAVDASSSRDTLASTGASPVPALFALAFLLAAAAGLALSRRLS